MPTNDRLGDPNNETNLLNVLELLVDLASDEELKNKNAEPFMVKRLKEKGYKDEQKIKDLIDQIKRSLPVRWDFSGLSGFVQSSRIQGEQQFSSEERGPRTSGRSEKNWLYFNLGKNATGKTTQEISKCLAANKSRSLNEVDISRALLLLQKLACYCPSPGTPSKSGIRRFALNFSACETRTLGGYKDFIKNQIEDFNNQIKDKHSKPEATANRTAGSVKKTDQRSNKHLNDLVEALLPKLKSNFEARRRHEQKHIHVPLKATIRPADWAKQEEPEAREPGPEDLMGLAGADDSQLLLIWEEGGAGKTSLAYEIASWGLEGRLADHPLLPYFLDLNGFELTSTASLSQHLVTGLDRLGGPDLSEDDVKKLLRHKRLLLIVDHFSELTKEQRDWVRAKLPARSLVLLTSRLADHKDDFVRNSWKVTEIKPQRLVNQELLDFFKEYVERSDCIREDVRKVLLDPEHSLRRGDLLQRMVGHKPVTVLLAWLVMQNAIKHIEERLKSPDGPADLPPNSIPELMEVYVRECCGDKSRSLRLTSRQAQDCKWNPGIILPSLKALALEAHRQNEAYLPNNFDTELAKRAFASVRIDGKPLDDDVQRGLLDALVGELTLVTCIDSNDTPESKVYRISLDPLADYLAALKQQEIWQSSGNEAAHLKQVAAWLTRIKGLRELGRNKEDSALEAVNHMRGFLAACRDCYLQWWRHPDHIKLIEPQQWQQCLNDFADLAKIDPQQERIMEAEYLIRRHAFDLEYNNHELRAKAIAQLSAYAQDIKAIPQDGKPRDPAQTIPEMRVALQPLALTLAEPTIATADRAAAAEALGHIGGSRAAEILIQRIDASEEPKIAVRRAAAEALGLVEAPGDDPEAHWRLLKEILADKTNHLDGDSFEAMDAKLPLLQGAARGLQRLASRSLAASCQDSPQWVWGAGPGLEVPMLTLTAKAGAVTTRLVRREVWQVPLPGGLQLELVAIPGGPATLGSPAEQVGRKAYGHRPEATKVDVEQRRHVTVPPFAMARFPISQAQWRSLAGPVHQREGGRQLQVDPSQHKGADQPVENVSWLDCSEWLKRLNRWLSEPWASLGLAGEPPRLDLPSETLWEVACRAGATTSSPFHFGDTLDAAWANYDGSRDDVYPGGRPGPYLQRPSPVGAYGLVNDWGLADLHGNVWEWCADLWHPSPQGGPVDGQAWMEPFEGLPSEQQRRLLRGGSWFNVPRNCRSAYRLSDHPALRNGLVGFRVCCLPPGLPSWSFSP
jgi:formylglycine-generating enzyme required for sulfatase activity